MLRFVRYQRDLQIGFGLLEQQGVVPLTGWIYDGWRVAGEAIPHSQLTLLAPCTPSKIIGAGLNYRSVAEAKGKELPAEPILFLKPPSAVIGPEAPIVYPSMVSQLAYEAEIAVVISRRCHRVDPEQAVEYVLGYTLANDVTAKDLLPASGPWMKGKGFDTFQPLGPAIVTDLDPESLSVEMWLNGERVQQGNTEDLIFSVPELVSYASQILTLEPGDVLLTGTPLGGGLLAVGDHIEACNEAIGRLANTVVAEGS
jgi:2-keto-4-pentenoate hydratase/2-oxohepta-3-ene-1,7-dioic acid hydratase in catechol pathway